MEKYERNREQDNAALEEKQEELAKCQRRRKKYETSIKKLKRQIEEAETQDSDDKRQEKVSIISQLLQHFPIQNITKQLEEEQKLKSTLKDQVSSLQEKLKTLRTDDTEDALLLLEAKLESERTATTQLQVRKNFKMKLNFLEIARRT